MPTEDVHKLECCANTLVVVEKYMEIKKHQGKN